MRIDLVMRVLKNGLEISDFAKTADSEKWLRQGIHDLDFDPKQFLATGQTVPEGWAK